MRRLTLTADGDTASFNWDGGLKTVFVTGDLGGGTLAMKAGAGQDNIVPIGIDNGAEWTAGDGAPINFELGNSWVGFTLSGATDPDVIIDITD